MTFYVITIEECFGTDRLCEKRTVTIPADDLDAAMVLLQTSIRGEPPLSRGRERKWWAVLYICCETMKTVTNFN